MSGTLSKTSALPKKFSKALYNTTVQNIKELNLKVSQTEFSHMVQDVLAEEKEYAEDLLDSVEETCMEFY